MMVTKLVLGLFVLYDLFPQLTAHTQTQPSHEEKGLSWLCRERVSKLLASRRTAAFADCVTVSPSLVYLAVGKEAIDWK